MRTQLTGLRLTLVLLLIGSAVLFLVGSTIERNHRHHETTATRTSETNTETNQETGGEKTHKSESTKPQAGHAETSTSGEAGAKILGVDTESLALSIIAVVLSLLLAAAVWLRLWPRLVLLAVFAFALVFAAGDARELVHQLDESNNGLAAVAAIVLALHLVTAAIAGILLRRQDWQRPVPVGEPA
jgi:hypothetical protein